MKIKEMTIKMIKTLSIFALICVIVFLGLGLLASYDFETPCLIFDKISRLF
jgi:hypothetical protein